MSILRLAWAGRVDWKTFLVKRRHANPQLLLCNADADMTTWSNMVIRGEER